MTQSTISTGLLRGLHYGVPIAGVIRTGYTVKRGDRRLPQRDDEFAITLKHKLPTGEWAPHPLDQQLREQHGVAVPVGEGGAVDRKLRRIPVVIAFDDPSLSISEQYAAFSNEGRPLCVGNGETCKRRVAGEAQPQELPCPGPGACEFGETARCDAFVRLLVQIENQGDEGSYFILRSGSINAVTDCRAVLESHAKLFSGLAGMPMWLVLEPKSSSMSKGTTFWYASLRPREADHLKSAAVVRKRRQDEAELGIDRRAYEDALVKLRQNGAFAETSEDGEQIEDLIIGRFQSEGDDGERRELAVGVRPGGSMSEVAQLTERLMKQAGALPGMATGQETTGQPPAAGAPL